MKKITLLFLLIGTSAYCQLTVSKGFEINGLWTLQVLRPVPFGDNSLAKAHSNKIGFAAEIGLVKYDAFRFGIGYNFVQYKVTDKQMIGNISNSNYGSIYGMVSHEFKITKFVSVVPDVGFGFASLNQRSDGRDYGSQNGNEFRLGVSGNYYISEYTSLVLGIHYINTRLDVNTSPEYEDFFGKMNQIQFAIGIQFD